MVLKLVLLFAVVSHIVCLPPRRYHLKGVEKVKTATTNAGKIRMCLNSPINYRG